MAPPLLKLVFVKGPKDGESVEYKPGSKIRIGRVVRGNEIAIKDAGISTKHLCIVSDSEKWIIHDLESSNGTILNSETLDPDTPVNLRHGDIIKLGEYSSIVVNFVTEDVQAEQEDKLPPMQRRNNRRMAVPDPKPDPDPVESKPTRRGRPRKQDTANKEDEPPKRTRTLEDIADKGKELKVVNSRVTRSRKVATRNVVKEEEEVPEEKKGKSRAGRGKNTETVQNSIKLEIPQEVETSAMTGSKQIGNAGVELVNVKSEDTVLEEETRASRATRSKKNKAPKSGATRKKTETRIDDVVEEEALNCPVEEEEDKESETQKEDESKRVEQAGIEVEEEDMNCSVREDGETEKLHDTIDEERNSNRKEEAGIEKDEKRASRATKRKNNEISVDSLLNKTPKRKKTETRIDDVVEEEALNCHVEEEDEKDNEVKKVEQVEIELEEDDLNCSVREDGETSNLQDTVEEERNNKSKEEAGTDEEMVEQVEKIDLEKMTAGEWFDYMEVYLRKKITEETEKMIEPMRSKALRVHKYIQEQKQAKGTVFNYSDQR